MGRHLWRIWHPSFFIKMLRSKAPCLYGWDILMRGTLWPGPLIGKKLAHIIGKVSDSGHEVGFHAWDHHAWQENIDRMKPIAIEQSISLGVQVLEDSTGSPPCCSATPAWKTNNEALLAKEKFPFTYNSDCRGESIFRPVVKGKTLSQPQIPVTLPTYDEVIGRCGVSDRNYNDWVMSLVKPERLNVFTIHAEVEGIARIEMFKDFLQKALNLGGLFVPLGHLLENCSSIGQGIIVNKKISGRQGWVSCQTPTKPEP